MSSTIENIRAKIKRKLSLHDKNPNIDEYNEAEDVDDETHGHLSREIEKAEADGHHQGKPGGFLNRLIMHGNKKTEDQLVREQAEREARAQQPTTTAV